MKFDSVILYESKSVENDFYPFSVLHPLWELRVGAMRIFEKFQLIFSKSEISFYSPNPLILDSFLLRFGFTQKKKVTKKNLILSSQLLPTENLKSQLEKLIKNEKKNYIIKLNENVVGFYTEKSLEGLFNPDIVDYVSFLTVNLDESFSYLNYIWEAINLNGNAINDDSKYYSKYDGILKSKYYGVYFINKNSIAVHPTVKIYPNVVIDASGGAVIIDSEAVIMAGSTIIGPCYIGKRTTIKVGAKIYGNTSIGEVCKVGGEVEGSIIQSYSNKQHDGFLGHSFISEWVNLGADTNTSDLKNTYSEITVLQRDREIKTGTMFLGLICGDHTKSAINTQFNTGTIAGVCGILVRPGFLPNNIKSFSWGGLQTSPTYKLSKALEVCQIVMQRRGRELNDFEKQLLQLEYDKVK